VRYYWVLIKRLLLGLCFALLPLSSDGQALRQFNKLSGLTDVSFTSLASGQVLQYNGIKWINVTTGMPLANPTGLIGLTAVNGSATTAPRSDSSPALDQSISPTWTGSHIFSFTDIQTSTTSTLLQFDHESTGTPAVGFGGNLYFQLKDSTTAAQFAMRQDWYWTQATHATRTSGYAIYLSNGGTVSLAMGLSATGVLSVPGNFQGTMGAGVPASSGSTGVAGTIAFDSNYIYVCTATNTWKRVALASISW
jgi:hypothetical protein